MAAVLEVFLLYSILYSSCLGIQPETRLEKKDFDSEPSEENLKLIKSAKGPLRPVPRSLNFRGVAAVESTTPSYCSVGDTCAFQVYEKYTREIIDVIFSCGSCPEGTECLYAGDSMGRQFYYYRCRGPSTPAMETTTEPMTEDAIEKAFRRAKSMRHFQTTRPDSSLKGESQTTHRRLGAVPADIHPEL